MNRFSFPDFSHSVWQEFAIGDQPPGHLALPLAGKIVVGPVLLHRLNEQIVGIRLHQTAPLAALRANCCNHGLPLLVGLGQAQLSQSGSAGCRPDAGVESVCRGDRSQSQGEGGALLVTEDCHPVWVAAKVADVGLHPV